MSNAVKSLSVPLAQCVKHRSSDQTLTGSNLAEYPLFILASFLSSFVFILPFLWSLFSSTLKKVVQYWR